ncbi:DNA-processing protein DprA [Thioalkalivibrio sp. HK1]|uniref:DNA-processing protein DprA n=1 Tax=Thioalkalivibrio sp. HK1 TaxID=1469245 RepID=UPI000470CF03|nr:DNA-processing protein DprA [Thioalkalivibrio sp. HK1]
MFVSPKTQAVLLLTSHFSRADGGLAKPLTPGEWGRFAIWLKERSLTPEALLGDRPRDILEGWSDRRITLDRIEALLNRGAALAIAVERWLRAGLWVMTRSDGDYPIRLKRRLGADSPAVLYGCGDRTLLDRGGLAVVGSRKAGEDDLGYARRIGAAAARQGHGIVSGGAKGVDQASMHAALENEGTVVGVLSDGLLRASSASKYRVYLREKRLVLVSAVHPEAGFSAGNAMGRNKYIYCLGDAALVVRSGIEGGTWNGASENIEKRWVPLWIKPTNDSFAGNDALVKRGARWVCEDVDRLQVKDLWGDSEGFIAKKADLFSPMKPSPEIQSSPEGERGERSAGLEVASEESEASSLTPEVRASASVESGSESESMATHSGIERKALSMGRLPSDESLAFYDLFLRMISRTCAESAKTPDEIAELLDVNKAQVNAWLRRAQAERRVRCLANPVRYEWIDARQASLFGN